MARVALKTTVVRSGPAKLAMSELGQTRRFCDVRGMSGLTPTADISGPGRHFAFVPIADLPATGVAQLIQKLFGRDQIGSPETLRKAVVDWLKAGDGVGAAALTAQQAGEARRRAQLVPTIYAIRTYS
jgi:hypothetical protein